MVVRANAPRRRRRDGVEAGIPGSSGAGLSGAGEQATVRQEIHDPFFGNVMGLGAGESWRGMKREERGRSVGSGHWTPFTSCQAEGSQEAEPGGTMQSSIKEATESGSWRD